MHSLQSMSLVPCHDAVESSWPAGRTDSWPISTTVSLLRYPTSWFWMTTSCGMTSATGMHGPFGSLAKKLNGS